MRNKNIYELLVRSTTFINVNMIIIHDKYVIVFVQFDILYFRAYYDRTIIHILITVVNHIKIVDHNSFLFLMLNLISIGTNSINIYTIYYTIIHMMGRENK